MTIPIGHFLSALITVLGDFTELTACGTVLHEWATIIDEQGEPTGQTIKSSVPDQIALAGILQLKGNIPSLFVNLHFRAALPVVGEHGRGRTALRWIIDGELGTIEVQDNPVHGVRGGFIGNGDKLVILNGEEVDKLDNTGKAWLEFATGEKGKYWSIDDSVKLHQVLDAALTSLRQGKKVNV